LKLARRIVVRSPDNRVQAGESFDAGAHQNVPAWRKHSAIKKNSMKRVATREILVTAARKCGKLGTCRRFPGRAGLQQRQARQ